MLIQSELQSALINLITQEYNQKGLTPNPKLMTDLHTYMQSDIQAEELYATLEDLGSNIIENPIYWLIADLVLEIEKAYNGNNNN